VEGALSNLALYRKYRSADFDEVVGQQHVVKTLTNAIKSGKHSHAYLLTGPRGVGKTTIARIIAKQLNGLKKEDSLDSYLDIIEIDGASNRGIDEIRSLREKVQVSPAKLDYKVYIIDEVHMLTKEAFNALLKTLEEPPSHVVFIFATTEVHKLPDTIISRTQRFDFKSIPQSDMVSHLRFIADSEKIKIDDEALASIAQISKGGFRDAISLLDQLSSIGEEINIRTVSDFTGLQDNEMIKSIFDSLSSGDFNKALQTLRSLFTDGADASQLAQQMLDYIQLKLAEDGSDQAFLISMAENIHWAQTNMRHSSSPELVLQVGLVRNSSQSVATSSGADATTQAKDDTKKQPPQETTESKSSSEPIKNNEELLLKSLSVIKHYNNSLFAVLKGADLSIAGEEVKIKCRFSFHKDRIMEQRNTNLIEKAFSKVYGKSMHLVVLVDNQNKPKEIDPAEEVVKSAAAIFGVEITDA
jgi:DNA polymerase-3 subunit gamma/tau